MILATVRNTGSNSALSIFEPHYTRHNGLYEPPTGNDLWFSHTETSNLPQIQFKASVDGPLVLTMRNPLEVARSWIKRRKTLDREFTEMWRNLFALSKHPDAFWLPVDTEDRDEYLAKISERSGKVFRTGWERKGVTGNDWPWESGPRPDEMIPFFETLPFEQFGYGYKC